MSLIGDLKAACVLASTPDLVICWVQVLIIRRPQFWTDESGASLEQAWPYFYMHGAPECCPDGK